MKTAVYENYKPTDTLSARGSLRVFFCCHAYWCEFLQGLCVKRKDIIL